MRLLRGFRAATVLAVAAAFAAGGCSGDTRLAPPITGPDSSSTTAPAGSPPTSTVGVSDPNCTPQNAVRSYAPEGAMPAPGAMPAGTTMAVIQAHGKLRVGVSGDTLLFGARNPITGVIEGFDIDVLNRIAAAIFGPPPKGAKPNSQLEIKVITYAQRLPVLIDGDVDLVAHSMTINCKRWQQIAFSSEYFTAGQKVLVKKDSTYQSINDIDRAGATVCAPAGSTNLEEVDNKAKYPTLKVITRPDVTDCLAAMQEGLADAATGDDTVLAGFVAQDPSTEVRGKAFTSEPYGVGVNAGKVDLVGFVNGVLEEMRQDPASDESLAGLARKWLTGRLDPIPDVPAAEYGRQ